ncbi:HNH endonuclease [Neobacillus drentensis]|uniref:HNH endonuclease n=1 Tax=Neobacillus drentensis TaxID=220684 RepID=UPI001F26177A|nr:HNH endonuclease [Neobacillus drentensis]ULT55873.1 HNH endonuclease [Neobacillus drentensis]
MKCAYCNNEIGGKLVRTKEHVIPNGLIKLFPDDDVTFMEKRSFKDNNGLTIGDVCNLCNNGVLSDLDGYGNKLISDNFMCSFGIADNYNKEFPFEFNYHLLSRWLLKIAYNYDRMEKSDSAWFKDNINYIMEGENNFKGNYSLFAGLHINMLPVLEEVNGKRPLAIIKNPKLWPLGATYSVYNKEKNREVTIGSGLIESIYVIRFASAVFLLVLWKDGYEEEKVVFEDKMNKLFTFEKLVPEKYSYKIRRVSEAFNSITGYGAISGEQGLEFSENLIKASIQGRNFWEARAIFAKRISLDFLAEGRKMIEAIEFPKNRKQRRLERKKR